MCKMKRLNILLSVFCVMQNISGMEIEYETKGLDESSKKPLLIHQKINYFLTSTSPISNNAQQSSFIGAIALLPNELQLNILSKFFAEDDKAAEKFSHTFNNTNPAKLWALFCRVQEE